MNLATADPARFRPYSEPLRTTLVRTCLIALVVGTVVAAVRMHRLRPGSVDAAVWFATVVSVLWISLGGHWVEVGYLNILRPRLARLPDGVLIFVRIAVWLIGGTLLVTAALITYTLLTTGQMPSPLVFRTAARYGGLAFVFIELVPHTILALLGRPSFWNRRG